MRTGKLFHRLSPHSHVEMSGRALAPSSRTATLCGSFIVLMLYPQNGAMLDRKGITAALIAQR